MSEEVKARENLEKAAFLQCAPLTNLMNCARRYYFAFSFLFLSLFGFVCEVHAQTAAGPLRVFSANPRYFTDGTGVAVLLTGAHEGWELQDNAFESARIF